MLTLKTATKTIRTKCRTPKGVLSAWACGSIPLDVREFEGAEIWKADKLIGTIVPFGWIPA